MTHFLPNTYLPTYLPTYLLTSSTAYARQFFEGAARGQGGKKGDSGGLQWGPTRRVIADAIYG